MTTTTPTRKDLSSAYLFAVLLAPVAAHRIYLGHWGTALLLAGLWWGGWIAIATRTSGMVVVLGAIAVIGAFVWWVIDLCLMPEYVRAANAKLEAPTPLFAVPTP